MALAFASLLFTCGPPGQGISSWQPDESSVLLTGPYILLGEEGVAHIAMRVTKPGIPIVEWSVGSDEGPYSRMPATARGDLFVVTLTQLPAGDVIRYRVVTEQGSTPFYSFRVAAGEGEAIQFAAFGDTRTGHSVHRAVIETMDRENIDFVIHTGDMVANGGRVSEWEQFFQIERPLLAHVPILPSIGNHDMSGRGNYRHYFLHDLWAKGRRYYAKDWGNLRVIALDSGIECRDGCNQYQFAEQALRDAAEKDMLVIIFLHFPPFSSGKHGSSLAVQEPITALAKTYGVELIIAGHDHNYERTKPIDGTTYIVSGSAGAPIRAVNPKWFTAHARTEPHFVLLKVENNRIVLRAINLRGETFDTAIIDAVPPRR
ncbi:MAG: metallophosphoesterase [Kofleriaceae bacterium]|nr:metallophosphoesterase [Kofleriaceae bacterium]